MGASYKYDVLLVATKKIQLLGNASQYLMDILPTHNQGIGKLNAQREHIVFHWSGPVPKFVWLVQKEHIPDLAQLSLSPVQPEPIPQSEVLPQQISV